MPSAALYFSSAWPIGRPISHNSFCKSFKHNTPFSSKQQDIETSDLCDGCRNNFNDVPFSIGLISHYKRNLDEISHFCFFFFIIVCSRTSRASTSHCSVKIQCIKEIIRKIIVTKYNHRNCILVVAIRPSFAAASDQKHSHFSERKRKKNERKISLIFVVTVTHKMIWTSTFMSTIVVLNVIRKSKKKKQNTTKYALKCSLIKQRERENKDTSTVVKM